MSVFTITIKLYNFSFELKLNQGSLKEASLVKYYTRFDVMYFSIAISAYIKTYCTIRKHNIKYRDSLDIIS